MKIKSLLTKLISRILFEPIIDILLLQRDDTNVIVTCAFNRKVSQTKIFSNLYLTQPG